MRTWQRLVEPLDSATIRELKEAVRPLARRLNIDRRLQAYSDRCWSADSDRFPVLHLEDVSGIPFVSIVPGVEEYQHRARVRAGDGQLFATVTAPADGYERYCRDRLRLGSPELIVTDPGDHPYAVARALAGGEARERLAEVAKRAGGLTIHPYMAIEDVWDLAGTLSHAASVPVRVLGPPPPALWVANDKSALSEVVASTVSADWIVETHTASDPAAMAEHMRVLAERHPQVGLKRTRCASATGNAVFDPAKIARMTSDEILGEVRSFLERTEWACDEEVLIVAWERTDDSPSTQLWIPAEGQGPPRIDGVYEQILEGEEKVFLGSRPSTLGAEIDARLCAASLRVAVALQSLGYVGRCSFDFILVRGADGTQQAKFVECNGRWGGTSTPMHLVDRLIPQPRPTYWAQDFMHRGLVGAGFDELLERVGDAVFDPLSGRGRYIFYNVGPLAKHGKLDVIALGSSAQDAEDCIHEDLPRRLGL